MAEGFKNTYEEESGKIEETSFDTLSFDPIPDLKTEQNKEEGVQELLRTITQEDVLSSAREEVQPSPEQDSLYKEKLDLFNDLARTPEDDHSAQVLGKDPVLRLKNAIAREPLADKKSRHKFGMVAGGAGLGFVGATAIAETALGGALAGVTATAFPVAIAAGVLGYLGIMGYHKLKEYRHREEFARLEKKPLSKVDYWTPGRA